MAAYRRVYDSRHLQADCQEPGSAPEPYARQSSMDYLYPYLLTLTMLSEMWPAAVKQIRLTQTMLSIYIGVWNLLIFQLT